jgi:two-component system, chemotaxis family, CheB/CheR fusion protein
MNTILNLLSLQANAVENQTTKNILQDSAVRVQSMMVLYDKLFRSGYNSDISVKEYFTSLIKEIISIFPQEKLVNVKTQLDDIILNVKILSPIGIVFNELITNSIKYAFPNLSEGIITITAIKNENLITIIFEDNGIGMPESINFENTTGFGLQLVKILINQINGSIVIERKKGTKFVIKFEG